MPIENMLCNLKNCYFFQKYFFGFLFIFIIQPLCIFILVIYSDTTSFPNFINDEFYNLDISINSMSLELQEKYLKEAQEMAQKSRYGYFSIPPNFRAAITDNPLNKSQKQTNITKTQSKNFYVGNCRKGNLKKDYITQVSSIYIGDPYDKPKAKLRCSSENKNSKIQEVFKPCIMNKTLMSASYKYMPNIIEQKCKNHKGSDGRVLVDNPNISANLSSKIDQDRQKQFTYIEDPYENAQIIRKKIHNQSISKRGQEPFRCKSARKQYFTPNKQLYGDFEYRHREEKKKSASNFVKNQQSFKPSGHSRLKQNGLFEAVTYIPHGYGNENTLKKRSKLKLQNHNLFVLGGKHESSKPTPSISCNRANLMKKMR